jgi:FG-GAP repeat
MNGLQIKAEGTVAHAPVTNDWHVQSVGDYDGDGNADIFWRNDNGQVYVWEMNGLQVKAEGAVAHVAVTNDWHIQA